MTAYHDVSDDGKRLAILNKLGTAPVDSGKLMRRYLVKVGKSQKITITLVRKFLETLFQNEPQSERRAHYTLRVPGQEARQGAVKISEKMKLARKLAKGKTFGQTIKALAKTAIIRY